MLYQVSRSPAHSREIFAQNNYLRSNYLISYLFHEVENVASKYCKTIFR